MLEKISSPKDIKRLNEAELDALASEIREKIIETVSVTGGHLASNLGAVELTLAVHRVFDAPEDKIVFDVGHQCYTHKLLTGRYERFGTLRQAGGISGFTRVTESEYDTVSSGHASDSISLALGMARARDMRGEKHNVIAVLGDGALTGGMCFEALSDAGQSNTKLILLLNDNEMSISPNVGALAKHLTHMRQSGSYRGFKQKLRKLLDRLPRGGNGIYKVLSRLKDAFKSLLVSDMLFESLDIEYLGPIDGHNIKEMERTLESAKTYDRPVLVHVKTRKGKGYGPAEEQPGRFHGAEPFDIETGLTKKPAQPTCGALAADILSKEAEMDPRICAVSAAMLSGTGLESFKRRFPERCFDVGIAEEHAAAMAAGMALMGQKPALVLYSTFLQRACDQININICLNNAPVVLLIDRAGLNGADGETHQGIFDVSILRALPGMTVAVPATKNELKQMLKLALASNTPYAVRYPKALPEGDETEFETGSWEEIKRGGDVCVIASGRMVAETQKAIADADIGLVNARYVKPLDEKMLKGLCARYEHIITVEDNIRPGGLGEAVKAFAGNSADVTIMAVPDMYIPAGTIQEQLALCGLDAAAIAAKVKAFVK